MRQNTSSSRACLPFQCFHTSTASGQENNHAVLFVRGANHERLNIRIVTFPWHEPVMSIMKYTGTTSGIHRFISASRIDKGPNLLRYCFKIELLSPKEPRAVQDVVWYSSLGMSRERPLLQHCFAYEFFSTHPQWAPETVFYQIFPDRFAASQGFFNVDGTKYPANRVIRSGEFEYVELDTIHCGGDLDGIADMIPYIRELGCDGIYLTPIFKAPSVHKFDTTDYDTVDPHFGGNGALKRLRAIAMGYEVKIIVLGSFNQSGDSHPWFDRQERTGKGALRHQDSPFREFYTFYSDGEPCYCDNSPDMPKLDYSSREIRHAMFQGPNSFVRKWLRGPYALDGWVIDHAAQIGDNGTASHNRRRLVQLCQAARETHIDCLMLGNFRYDARYALNIGGSIDGSVNYTGFLSPVRAFFGGVDLNGSACPYTGEDLRRACEEYSVGVSQQAKLCLLNQLDNYDLPRFFTLIGKDKNLYLAALAALYTWRGIPCIYQGDELGDVIAQAQLGPRSLMPFTLMKEHHVSTYSSEIQGTLAALAAMRRHNPALTRGSMVFISAGGADFGFIRIYHHRFSIVFVNASHQQVKLVQGSRFFPLLAAMYLPADGHEDDSTDSGEDLLIPLSGRNVRRTDHGEGLQALYEMLSREKLSICCYGAVKSTEEFRTKFEQELCSGKPLTLPARSTVVINNQEQLKDGSER